MTAGPEGGAGWVSVEVDGAGRDSVPVQVFVPSEDVFGIVLVYADGVPERWRSFLEAAARRWEATMAGDRRLRYLALHEMGHALGLVAVVQGVQPEWYDPEYNAYRGAMALEGWRRVSGKFPDALLENGGHWVLPGLGDVMSWRLCGECPITLPTIGGLLDLGYPAVWKGAGEGLAIGN